VTWLPASDLFVCVTYSDDQHLAQAPQCALSKKRAALKMSTTGVDIQRRFLLSSVVWLSHRTAEHSSTLGTSLSVSEKSQRN
jgi:hypothetical protein